MAQRRSARKQARRDSNKPRSYSFLWFSAGLISGLALATYAWFNGILPPQQQGVPQEETSAPPSSEVAPAENEKQRKFDFYTVLPEMEVVVPDQEISATAGSSRPAAQTRGPYFLQVGSFRKEGDAESQKAKLALLGVIAQVQSVTVDNSTWHRVRVGPIESARETDAMRRRLEENDLEAMILRGQQ